VESHRIKARIKNTIDEMAIKERNMMEINRFFIKTFDPAIKKSKDYS
jgi:hypothetical protein